MFGQLGMMRGSQTGLPKHNYRVQEGMRMRKRKAGAEHGLQAMPGWSNKNSQLLAALKLQGSEGAREEGLLCRIPYQGLIDRI